MLTGVTDRENVYVSVIAPYKSALELWYTRNQSFWLDLKLIVFTFVAMLRPNFDIAGSLRDLPPEPAELAALRKGVRK